MEQQPPLQTRTAIGAPLWSAPASVSSYSLRFQYVFPVQVFTQTLAEAPVEGEAAAAPEGKPAPAPRS